MTTDPRLTRRRFLRSAGVAIALPFLPSLFPARLFGGDAAEARRPPRRLLFLSVGNGFVPNLFVERGDFNVNEDYKGPGNGWWPESDGPDYRMTNAHPALEPFRKDISFLKGLCHLRFRGDSHSADDVFLTGADTKGDPSRAFVNTVSCDEFAARSPALGGDEVRYTSLSLGVHVEQGTSSTGGLSWTAQGTPVPPIVSPVALFDRLFGSDDVPAEVRRMRFQERRSVLDATLAQAEDLDRTLDDADRRKLDEVRSAVRDAERSLQREEAWLGTPKPKVDLTRPAEQETSSAAHCEAMYRLIHAAFLTDSTRVVSYELPTRFSEVTPFGRHGLSHGSGQVAKDALAMDRAYSDRLAGLLKLLNDSRESDGQPLLFHVAGAFGSASWGVHHGMRNLPILGFGHAGGRLRQGETRQFADPTPLANLWLTMMRACGVDASAFADSTGVLDQILA